MGAYVGPLTGFLDAALTDFAKRFTNNMLFADRIAPRIGVPYQSGKYWIFAREAQELLQNTLRAAGSPAQRIRRSLSTASFFADSHALEAEIPDEDSANYQAGNLKQDATQDLIQKILLDKENRLATILTDTAQVTNNTTLAGTSQWSDYGNSTPTKDVQAGKSQIAQAGVQANFMLVGEQVFDQLINHPSVVDRFKYTQRGNVNQQDLAQLFGVSDFFVGAAVQVDKAGTVSFVWGKHAILGYISPTATREDLSGCKSFVWEGAPGTIGGFGTIVGRNPRPSAKADLLSTDFYYDQKITAVEALYLIKNAVA